MRCVGDDGRARRRDCRVGMERMLQSNEVVVAQRYQDACCIDASCSRVNPSGVRSTTFCQMTGQ